MEHLMLVDRYTKAVLTIIALCLLWLSLGGGRISSSAHAQDRQSATTRPFTRPFPTVIKAGDFGYRVDGWRSGESPVGTLVVQIDGGWYEARLH
jgi:hypothetical protein